MDQNFKDACNDSGYFTNSFDINGTPYQLDSTPNVIREPSATPFVYTPDNLTQQPFGYTTSDLKDFYLSRETLTEQKDVSQKM
jgi:hypothetical protein